VVFKSETARQALEAILHPRIRKAWKEWAAEQRKAGAARAVVVIPLLFETGAEKQFDLTVCVACLPDTQRRRLIRRDWSDEQINARNAAQMPVREKMERAHRVVWSEYSLDKSHTQLARIFASV
jgi:dephospho-CoA kinase